MLNISTTIISESTWHCNHYKFDFRLWGDSKAAGSNQNPARSKHPRAPDPGPDDDDFDDHLFPETRNRLYFWLQHFPSDAFISFDFSFFSKSNLSNYNLWKHLWAGSNHHIFLKLSGLARLVPRRETNRENVSGNIPTDRPYFLNLKN